MIGARDSKLARSFALARGFSCKASTAKTNHAKPARKQSSRKQELDSRAALVSRYGGSSRVGVTRIRPRLWPAGAQRCSRVVSHLQKATCRLRVAFVRERESWHAPSSSRQLKFVGFEFCCKFGVFRMCCEIWRLFACALLSDSCFSFWRAKERNFQFSAKATPLFVHSSAKAKRKLLLLSHFSQNTTKATRKLLCARNFDELRKHGMNERISRQKQTLRLLTSEGISQLARNFVSRQ